jgi:hypothetical protein
MSFIHDDTDLLKKLLKLGAEPQSSVDINKQNLIRLIKRLIASYQTSQTTAPVGTQTATDRATAEDLSRYEIFNGRNVNFHHIEKFATDFAAFAQNPEVTNMANGIHDKIQVVKHYMKQPIDIVNFGSANDILALTNEPYVFLQQLRELVQSAVTLYADCEAYLQGKVSDVEVLKHNILAGKDNLITIDNLEPAIRAELYQRSKPVR